MKLVLILFSMYLFLIIYMHWVLVREFKFLTFLCIVYDCLRYFSEHIFNIEIITIDSSLFIPRLIKYILLPTILV